MALRVIERIPRGSGKLGDQLFRAATAMPANIAEGVGKRSRAERRNYYDHARGCEDAHRHDAHLTWSLRCRS